MKQDFGSSYTAGVGLAHAEVDTGSAGTSASIDHGNGVGAFVVDSSLVDASSVGTAVVHYSDDDFSADDDVAANVTAVVLGVAGVETINVPNPLKRYSRLVVTMTGTNGRTFAIVNVQGPLRHSSAASTTGGTTA